MIEMVTNVPQGSCPSCGHKQFIVSEIQSNNYLTDRDGYIIDHNESMYSCVGMCLNCKKTFEMLALPHKFIPMTRLRKILYENEIIEEKFIENPMEVKK